MSATPRLLIWDGAPDELLDDELGRAAAACDVTVNVHRNADPEAVRRAWSGRVRVISAPIFDLPALLAEVRRDGTGFDAVKSRANVPLPEAFFAAATDAALARPLRVVGQVGSGIGHIALDAAARHGVVVTHTPGTNAVAVAEFILAQLLAVLRGLVPHSQATHAGRWRGQPVGQPRELSQLTLGLAGFGHTGRALAQRAVALGMPVAVWRAHSVAAVSGIRAVPTLEQLLATCDVLSVHLRRTPRTEHLIGRRELARMRPGAIVVNAARGGIVDERALADALLDPAHPVSGAAVDVFTAEHDGFGSPLLGVPAALLTPHIAGLTAPAMAAATRECVDNVVRALRRHENLWRHEKQQGLE